MKALDGFPMVSVPGEAFTYNNGGYVVLALIAERASGVPFHDLIGQRVCEPAGLAVTGFLRSDELPGDAAIGFLANVGLRTNVFHLPVRGNGDGGIYSTALFAGQIVHTRGSMRWCDLGASTRETRCETDSASGSERRARLRSTATMPVSRSGACTTPHRRPPRRISRTPPRGRGRSRSCSTSARVPDSTLGC